MRLIEEPREALPLRNYEIVCGRGPFSLDYERQLLRHYKIDILVCKASGGTATEAKLIAAREAGIPVIMVRRPPREPGDAVEFCRGGAQLDRRDRPAAGTGENAMNARSARPLATRSLTTRSLTTRHPAVRYLGGALIMLFALVPGARADWDMFSTYFNNVARAAAANDAGAVTRLVVGGGYKADNLDESGRTGLQIAATNGNLQIAAILIKAGANVNLKDRIGNTAFARRDRAQPDRNGRSADRCRRRSQQREQERDDAADDGGPRGQHGTRQKLIEKGANARKTDFTGRDAISWAQESRRPAVVQLLQRAVARGDIAFQCAAAALSCRGFGIRNSASTLSSSATPIRKKQSE